MFPILVHVKPSGTEAWINGSMFVAIWVQGGDTMVMLQGMTKAEAFAIEETPGELKQAILDYAGE